MKRVLAVLLTFITSLALAVPALANDRDNLEWEAVQFEETYGFRPSFQVGLVYPVNQVEGVKQMFDLIIEPNQSQKLYLELYNPTDEDVTVIIEAVQATTEKHGGIDYERHGRSHSTLLDPFPSLVINNSQTATIRAKELIEVEIEVRTPRVYEGIILGSLRVTEVVEPSLLEDISGFPVLLRRNAVVRMQSKFTQTITPDFKFADYRLLAGHTTSGFFVDVINPMPALFKGTTAFMRLLHDSEVVVSDEQQVNFAPHGIYPLELYYEGALTPGIYTAQVELETCEGVRFSFEHSFTVDALDEEADETMREFENQKRSPGSGAEDLEESNCILSWWWLILLILLLVTALVVRQIYKKSKTRKDGHNEN